jgi:hypothetical protein
MPAKFTYKMGDRPLEGFTLKRGIGQGGFGEVYYALSDGGKEVALKLVQRNAEVELRGMAQCLNVKHPHLVTLYDIKKDARGDTWVVMEYVSGESLSTLLSRYPKGLPIDLARQWFLQMAQAVGHLHENGIVHRDLKPGNVFIENGVVKVGDYGLCKIISGSQQLEQTQSVGTVHYMAPEVASGKYGHAIDIYAAGVILYEMLTGQLPFDGQSAAEILMKHLTAQPDLSIVPGEFSPIIAKALAKDPQQRFASMREMIQAIEGQPVAAAPARPAGNPAPVSASLVQEQPPVVIPVRRPWLTLVGELSGSLGAAAVVALLFSILWTAVEYSAGLIGEMAKYGAGFYLMTLASWSVLVPTKLWEHTRGDSWARRGTLMVLGLLLGVGAAWFNGWSPHWHHLPPETPSFAAATLAELGQENPALAHLFGYMSYFGLAFLILRWWRLAERHRPQRFRLAPVLVTGLTALLLVPLWPDFSGAEMPWTLQGPVVLTLTSAIVQVVSPWVPPAPKRPRPLRYRYA